MLAFLLLLGFSPHVALAQTARPYAQYCPDPTQIFTGVALDENGKPRIELLVESSFEQRMQIERKLGSLPVTPIYDLVIRVVPTINEYCLPQYDENGTLIQKVDPPGTLPFTVYFTLGNEILLGGTATHYASQKTEKGEPYYEWEKKGWPNGIFVSEKLERVIKAVQENDPTLRIGVLVDRSYNDAERVEKPISFTLCVPLAGGSPHTIVYMRSTSSKLEIPQLVVGVAEGTRLYGFEEIEPLKTYSLRGSEGSYFAHFADLSLHDDTGWATVFKTFFVFANKEPQKISACGKNASQYFFPTARIPKNGGYAPYGGGVAFISPGMPVDGWIHEFAHSFSGLEDNYRTGFDITLYYANCAPPGREPHWGSVARSRAFGGDGFYYGDRVKGCSVSGQYRPSGDNLMCGTGSCNKSNSYAGGTAEFDVVSCGYLRTAIEHDTAYLHSFPKSELIANWERCKKMKGIIQPSISTGDEIDQLSDIPRSTSRLLAAVFPALTQASPDSGETVNLDFNSPYISVETFADNGSISAEIFERVGADKGEQTEWRKVETKEDSAETSFAEDGASGGGLNWVEKDGIWVMQLLDESGKVFHEIPLPPKEELSFAEEPVASALTEVAVGPNPVRAESPLTIRWKSEDISNVKIELLNYKTEKVERTIEASVENKNAYEWTVPDDLDDDVYRIRVSDASNPAAKAISDKFDIGQEKKAGLLARAASFVREAVSSVISKAVRKSVDPSQTPVKANAFTIGEQRVLVLLIDYADSNISDRPFTPEEAQKIISEGDFARFYSEQSYGRISFVDDVYGWFRLDRNYLGGSSAVFLTKDELEKILSENNIDFKQYRYLIIMDSSPGSGAGLYVGSIYPFGHELKRTIIGVGGYESFKNERRGNMSLLEYNISHEMAHALGVPHPNYLFCNGEFSLLKINNCESYHSSWGITGSNERYPVQLTGFSKEQLGWITPQEIRTITQSGEYSINPLEEHSGMHIAKIPISPTEAYYIEYRRGTGYDSGIYANESLDINQNGVFVYYINKEGGKIPARDVSANEALIDMAPRNPLQIFSNGNVNVYKDMENVALGVGKTFTDAAHRIAISPLNADERGVRFKVTVHSTAPFIKLLELPPRVFVGEKLKATWSSENVPRVRIELFNYKVNKIERVIEASVENKNAYEWTVPDDLDDDVYRIRVSDASNPAAKAISDKFDIAQEKKTGILARAASFVHSAISKIVRKSAPPVPAEESCDEALSSGMLSPALSALGFYHDRMCRLRQSVTAALDAWEKKVNLPRGGKGGEALKGDRALDAPLYLLRKMKKSLEPEARGGLKDSAGLNRFFARLRSLRDFSDPLFDDIFRRAEEFQGFSYLFPPESGKPLLIFVPGANGEAGWRGAAQLLTAASEHYNILGYTYDATVPAGEMVRRLRSHVEQRKLHERESVIVMMSLGNTLVHSAIAKDLDSQLLLFSKSRVVSVGFLPGGSSKFLGKPDAVPALAKKIFPPYASIFEMMDPRNPEQEGLAANIERIIGATRGIMYIQASEDDHIDFKSSASPYAHNRDKIFSAMKSTLRSVTPPHLYQKGNNHVNLLYAPEVEKVVNGLAPLLKSSPRSAAPSFLSVSELFSSARRLSAAASLSRGGRAGMLDIISSLIGSPQDECAVLKEMLEDGKAVSSPDEYAQLLGAVKDYATLSELPCSSGIGETPAAQESIGSPNLSATAPTISGAEIVARTGKVLVLPVDFLDSKARPYTREELHSLVFEGQVQKFFAEQSYGRFRLEGDTLDWARLPKNGPVNSNCASLTDAELEDIIDNTSVDISKYRYVLFLANASAGNCAPVGGSSKTVSGHTISTVLVSIAEGVSAFGYVPQPFPWTSRDYSVSHELGHALGADHANGIDCGSEQISGDCRLLEYRNFFDAMGSGIYGLHFTALYKERLGWLKESDMLTVRESGRYSLDAYESDSDGYTIAKIAVPNSTTGEYIYAEYRTPTGFDSGLRKVNTGTPQLLISVVRKDPGGAFASYLVDTSPTSVSWEEDVKDAGLTAGSERVYIDRGRGITVGPIVSGDAKSVTFEVKMGTPACQRSAPALIKNFINPNFVFPNKATVNAGEQGVISMGFANPDTAGCGASQFKVIPLLPPLWNYTMILGESPFTAWDASREITVNPGDANSKNINFSVPKEAAPGVYPVKYKVVNVTSGLESEKEFKVTVFSSVPIAPPAAGEVNLSVTTPTITNTTGSGAGEGKLYAGEMTLFTSIRRTGDATLPTFKNTLQYAAGDGPFIDWFSFDVPTFKAGHTAEFTYTWKGGEGIWGLRLCVDSGNAVPESDETDNCTALKRIEVIASSDAPSAIGTPSVEGGQPRLTLAVPTWSGTQAGEGRIRAGKMTLSARVTNSGNADSPPIRGVWQYSLGTGSFVDWIRIEFPALAPGAASNGSYSWEGGKGLWRARFCIEDPTKGGGRTCSGAVAADIVE